MTDAVLISTGPGLLGGAGDPPGSKPIYAKFGQPDSAKRDWDLFRVVKASTFNEGNHHGLADAVQNCQEFLAELSRIRCVACSGYGHTIKRCPTNRKLVARAKYRRFEGSIFNAARQHLSVSHGANRVNGKWPPLR